MSNRDWRMLALGVILGTLLTYGWAWVFDQILPQETFQKENQ